MSTGFVGSESEAREFVREWNEVADGHGSFAIRYADGEKYTITAFVDDWVLDNTNIKENFMFI